METLDLQNLVALTKALPEYNLRRGEIGVIIDIGPNDQYLLEFVDQHGRTYATPTVYAGDMLKVYLQPSLAA